MFAQHLEGDHLRDLAALDGTLATGATAAEAVQVVAAAMTKEAASLGIHLPATELQAYLDQLLRDRCVRMTPAEYLNPIHHGAHIEHHVAAWRALVDGGVRGPAAVRTVAECVVLEAAARGIAFDTSRETVADALRRMLEGPGTCYVCGSRVAMQYLCAVCEAVRLADHDPTEEGAT